MEHGPTTKRGRMQIKAFRVEFFLATKGCKGERGSELHRLDFEQVFADVVCRTSDDAVDRAIAEDPKLVDKWCKAEKGKRTPRLHEVVTAPQVYSMSWTDTTNRTGIANIMLDVERKDCSTYRTEDEFSWYS